MTELMQIARDLARFRNLRQSQTAERDVRSCYADALMMDYYGIVPGSDDMQASWKGYELLPSDNSGRSLKVIFREILPMRVYSRMTGFDAYVFVKGDRNFENFRLLGWMTGAEVVQGKIVGFEKDFCYEVNTENMIKMPNIFDFKEPCDTGAAIWDYFAESWDCIKCGRMVLDGKTRDAVQRELAAGSDTVETQAPQNLSTST